MICTNISTIACIICSVRATIERYKKACAASTNAESVSEANTQVIKFIHMISKFTPYENTFNSSVDLVEIEKTHKYI